MGQKFASSQAGPSQRQLRAGELIRHVVAELLQRGDIHDPDLPSTPVTVTEVKASPDLRNATVYCATLGEEDSREAVGALNKAAGKVRAALGKKIAMKYTPSLTFKVDDRFEEAARIDAILNRADVKRDL
ncbi:MAG: 30S ribosome-binding factor RbfA [Pseudomonadota bacterium]